MTLEDVLNSFKNNLIVIHNKDGYHYGTLIEHDQELIYLAKYHFNQKLITKGEYLCKSVGVGKGMIPKRDFISIQTIPLYIEREKSDIDF